MVILKAIPWLERINMTNNDMYMEDVATISLDAMREIENGLKKFNITLTGEQEDEFYVPIWEKLEKYSNGNYRREH